MKGKRKPESLELDNEEERKGLLTGKAEDDDEYLEVEQGWSRRKLVAVAALLILLLLSAALLQHVYVGPPKRLINNWSFSGDDVRSNGTHDFKRTVLIVSIDGLRADYLDRGFTPHLLDISKQGLRAKSMVPIFPTLTFPNHWALMTGLFAESHGIVANNFWDPEAQEEFHYNKESICWNPAWWYGEPMWETAQKANIITANLMWPGPPKTSTGASPTYFVPWKDKVPMKDKLDQVLAWIDMPFESRPQLIMAYEPSLDQAGHLTGPMSSLVNKTLAEVDLFAKDLHTSLLARNLTSLLDIVFVSDHGMTDTSSVSFLYLDDLLGGPEGIAEIAHEDGWPSMGLRFKEGANETHYLRLLEEASERDGGDKFEVYTHETMPARYHFSESERIAPIYVVPKSGYALTLKGRNDPMSKGNHGYDNEDLSMHAMFVAHGPFSSVTKALHQSQSRSLVSRALARPNKGWHSTSDDTYVMNSFQNVNIYNLVVKLLGIEEHAARTNGTEGFWDKYF